MSHADLQIDPHQLAAHLRQRARGLGFDLVGIAPAQRSVREQYLRDWLATGQAGSMHYLASRVEERVDPQVYLPGAQSVICVALNYHVPLDPVAAGEEQRHGRIARYALGDDYHEVIKRRLWELADWLRQVAPEAQTKAAVDTAPIMEKEWAALAGVGWMGKNTCLINPQIGSWLLLGEIVTTLPLPPDEPAIDRCGTCVRCLEACPTGAITAPYELDARRCISYLTIEHRDDDIDPELSMQIGDWLYGCDICQDVCPWNSKAPTQQDPGLQPRFPTGTLDVEAVLSWTPDAYRTALRGSAMKRVKLPVLQRNARIVKQNRVQR